MSSMSRVFSLISLALLVLGEDIVTSDRFVPSAQTWDFSAADRCRIYAHKSIISNVGGQTLLILDGGFGTFQTTLEQKQVQVRDLNPWTVAFDLSKTFSTPKVEPKWMYKKPYDGSAKFSITNHGGLWLSQDQNTIYYQGGHFYNGTNWTTSLYHVNKKDIPPWQLWQMDLKNHSNGWLDITNSTTGHESVIRTFAGTAASVPSLGKSFYLGGVIDDTTSPTTTDDIFQTTSQMLIYDEDTKTITKTRYYGLDDTNGYYQGNLIHLPIGQGKGYLISLMSLKKDVNTQWYDIDGDSGNIETADAVGFDKIQLYDLEAGEWIVQKTDWYNNENPPARTRFCSALFHDETDNTWNLWVHGGQLLQDQEQGVEDIYVLSMPSFLWSKVETPVSETNLRRSHTCHSVGGQLIVVGGYPPGLSEVSNATCDPEYLKVLAINEDGVSWAGSFSTSLSYKTPSTIREIVSNRTVPIGGFVNSQLATDFQYKPPATPTPTPTPTDGSSLSSKKTPVGLIAGVAGGVGALVIIAILTCCCCGWCGCGRRRTSSAQTEKPNNNHPSKTSSAAWISASFKGARDPQVTVTEELSSNEVPARGNQPEPAEIGGGEVENRQTNLVNPTSPQIPSARRSL